MEDDEAELMALARERAMRKAAGWDARMLDLLKKRERLERASATMAVADDESDARRAFPMEFGKGGGVSAWTTSEGGEEWERAAAREAAARGDRATPTTTARESEKAASSEEEESEDEYDEEDAIPDKSEAVMGGYDKPATCVGIDRSGTRMACGSSDGVVRLYDFAGMKNDFQPFRTITVREGYPMHAIDWSPTGDMFVAASGNWQPTVHSHDGTELGEFDKGDMYIRDLRNTKGHCAAATDAKWNPIDKSTVCTAGEDGSMRLWDINYLGDPRGSQKAVLKPQQIKPGRVHVTSCAYSHDGELIAGGINDGSIQIFSSKGSQYKSASIGLVLPPSQQCKLDNHWSFNARPSHLFRKAHPVDEEVTSMSFSRDGRTLVSRCGDGTLNVWDMRNLNQPLKRFGNLPTNHSETNVAWSPNDVYFFTGVDAERDGESAGLCFFSREKLEMVRRVSTLRNCIAATWHPRLNQVFIGCGDAKGGEVRVLYDAKKSMEGVVKAVGKVAKKKVSDFARIDVQEISYTPNALPAFQEPMPGKRKLDATDIARKALRKNPGKAAVSMDKSGILSGGTGSSLLTQHLMKNNEELGEKNWMTMDAREAILRHAEEAAKNPKYTKQAYEKTQPKPMFREEEDEKRDSD